MLLYVAHVGRDDVHVGCYDEHVNVRWEMGEGLVARPLLRSLREARASVAELLLSLGLWKGMWYGSL